MSEGGTPISQSKLDDYPERIVIPYLKMMIGLLEFFTSGVLGGQARQDQANTHLLLAKKEIDCAIKAIEDGA